MKSAAKGGKNEGDTKCMCVSVRVRGKEKEGGEGRSRNGGAERKKATRAATAMEGGR